MPFDISKKEGTLGICINYRLLYKETQLNLYPILHINELPDKLSNAKYFGKMDLYYGYY